MRHTITVTVRPDAPPEVYAPADMPAVAASAALSSAARVLLTQIPVIERRRLLGDTVCDHGCVNVVWRAHQQLWRVVVPHDDGVVLCPTHFIQRAEKAGIGTTGPWLITPAQEGW